MKTIRQQTEVFPVAEKQPEETNIALPSPGASWPKQSPVAAVQPQIRVKTEDDGEKRKGKINNSKIVHLTNSLFKGVSPPLPLQGNYPNTVHCTSVHKQLV